MYTEKELQAVSQMKKKRWWIALIPMFAALAAAIVIFVYGQVNRSDTLWGWTAALTDAWPATQGIQNVIIQNVICGWGCNAPETAISWTAAGKADHISWSGPQMAVYSCFDLHNIVDIKY